MALLSNMININYGDWLLIAVGLSILLVYVIFTISDRRGVNIQSNKFQIAVIVLIVFPLIVMPFWFTDISIIYKIIFTVLATVVGILNYVVIEHRKKIILENKNRVDK